MKTILDCLSKARHPLGMLNALDPRSWPLSALWAAMPFMGLEPVHSGLGGGIQLSVNAVNKKENNESTTRY